MNSWDSTRINNVTEFSRPEAKKVLISKEEGV
jgi:hypothetical protein